MFIVSRTKFFSVNQHLRKAIDERCYSTTRKLSTAQKRHNELNGKSTCAAVIERFGQPTSETHPHLLKKGELAPGVKVEEFKQRRQKIMLSIQKYALEKARKKGELAMNGNHTLIVPSATKKYMSDRIPYVFRQNSDFFYLTGCLEPDSILLLNINEYQTVQSILFMRPKDKHAELWDGPRTGVENAPHIFGVDDAYANKFFQQIYKKRARINNQTIWYDKQTSELAKIIGEDNEVPSNNTPSKFIQNMRLFKSTSEQNLMRRTCKIASTAINETMFESSPGLTEHQIFAMVDYKCRWHNATYLAYPPVVASGTNTTVIHYINNSQLIRGGDLVLMDAGCEYGGYTSDITRTWPIDGKFTDPQRVLYEIVLNLQKELIDLLLKEGGETLDNVFESMCIKLGKYLQEVGLVEKNITDPKALGKAGYSFCPHHVSHYLGMDVHDTPLMSRNIRLLPGMVFTVEPGIYIAHDRSDVPSEFRGLGVRIEDDILITEENAAEVLTSSCMKEILDIENMKKKILKI